MFKASQIRWLVTAFAAAAATLAMAAPASAWLVLDETGGPGNAAGSTTAEAPTPQILSNLAHEGRLADQRLVSGTRPDGGAGTVSPWVTRTYTSGVIDSNTGVYQQASEDVAGRPFTRPESSAGNTNVADLRNRDHIVADKAAPAAPTIPYVSQGQGVPESQFETYIPGVTDSTTGVYRDRGIEPPTVAVTREVSDDSFNWSSDLVIGISAALLTALLMALGTFALVNQRRRRMAL